MRRAVLLVSFGAVPHEFVPRRRKGGTGTLPSFSTTNVATTESGATGSAVADAIEYRPPHT